MMAVATRWNQEHTPADDTSRLTARDRDDLVWFWNQCEAEHGVRSNLGAQVELLQLYSGASDDEKRDSRSIRTAIAHNLRHAREEGYSPIHINPTRSTVWRDPYPDSVHWTVRRANIVRETLRSMYAKHVLVLYAVYGPRRGDEELNRTLRKRFGALAEIVVAHVAADDVPNPRLAAVSKLGEPTFVTFQKRQAEKLIAEAGAAYVEAKGEQPWI